MFCTIIIHKIHKNNKIQIIEHHHTKNTRHAISDIRHKYNSTHSNPAHHKWYAHAVTYTHSEVIREKQLLCALEIRLTPDEIQELRPIQKKEKFRRRRFIKAAVLLILHRGLPIKEICASLSLDDNTIYRYAKAFWKKDLAPC